MRHIKALMILFSGTLLAACNALQPAPTVTYTLTATLTSTLTATPRLTNTPQPTKTPAPSTSTPNALGFILPTEEPVTDWMGKPIMPDAIAGEESKEGGKASYAFTVKGDIVTVQNYYTNELPKKGWTLLTVGEGVNGNVIAIFTKGNDVLSVAIIMADQQEKLILVLLVPT